MTKTIIAPSDLHNILNYDPVTGAFFWKARRSGAAALNSQHTEGYLYGGIMGRKYFAHRVAWAMTHGAWPADQIDHINGDRRDNRAINLRAVRPIENNRNRKLPSNSSTGVIGVFWSNAKGKWRAKITDNGRAVHLGYFVDFASAVAARAAAEASLMFHQNHGRVASSV